MRFTASSKSVPVFPTYGVHNPPSYSPCAAPDCLYAREPDEPSDPLLPLFWTAKWTMYRVFRKYAEYSPPYDGPPPVELKEGEDYQVSYGASYYDSTWQGPNGEQGAMMEHYVDLSLTDIPFRQSFHLLLHFSGEQGLPDRRQRSPKGMSPICLFSDLNHPPRRDFIKHLPYSKGDTERLGGRVQGYSFWTSPEDSKPPIQTGASPDRTEEGAVLFGYAFHSKWEPDVAYPTAAPYRHAHSFYFSGMPTNPPNAPIVSQYFTDFAMIKPDPTKTWDLVRQPTGGREIPTCNLFGPPGSAG